MRISDYTIKAKLNSNQYVLAHGYTGAIDIVEKNVIEFFRNVENNRNAISDDTYNVLIKRGYLTKKSKHEEIEYLKTLANSLQMQKLKNSKKSFYFIPTYDCNFRCPYCYENVISDYGKNWTREYMNEKKVDNAFKTIDLFSKDGKIHNSITLYGGEPLLQKNANIVKYILKKGIEKKFVFRAITNGYDLDAYEEFLGTGKIEGLQITIDGPPEIHDKSRYLFDGSPTFNKIVFNISLALKKNVKINLRINLDKNSSKNIKDLTTLFDRFNWSKNKNFYFYIAAKRQYEGNDDCSYLEKESDLVNMWIDLKKDNPDSNIGTNDQNLTNYINHSINKNKIFQLKASFCGANSSMYLFDPLGDIYSCWDVVKQKRCKVGEYFPKFEIYQKSLDNWHNRHVGTIEKCSKCKYALFCGGGCEGALYLKKGTFFENHCNDFPNLFKKYLIHSLNTNINVQKKIAN